MLFFFSSRRRHTRFDCDWSSDVCSSDLTTSKGMTHFLGQVHGLFSDGTNVYAGGDFTEAGKVIVNGFAQWNRTNWSALGSVVNGQQPAVTAGAFFFGGGAPVVWGGFSK